MNHAKKTLIAFLATAMLMPGVYLAFRPTVPVQAQLLTFGTTLIDIGQIANWIKEAVVTGLETAVYKTLKSLAKSLAHKMAETALGEFATGKKGQEPFWSTKAWDKEMKDIGGKFLSFGLQGMASGFEKGMNRSKKQALRDKEGSLIEGSAADRERSDSAKTAGNKDDAAYYGKRAEDSANKAKNIRSQVEQMEKNDVKRAEAARRGQEGGTSEEVAGVLKFLCNPSANVNVSLKISLGIGSFGEDPDEEPICNVNEMAKNWQAMYDQFSTFDPSKINAWNTMANLFDTDSSDIGVAFNAHTSFSDTQEKNVAAASMAEFMDKLTGKPQEDEAGSIQTPGDMVREQLKSTVLKGEENASDPVKSLTGKTLADAADIVGTFVDSLLSKGMDYLKQGLVRNIKAWQEASKDKEFNKLADVLENDAKAKAARDAEDAAKARLAQEERKLATVKADEEQKTYQTQILQEEATANPSPTTQAAVTRAQTVAQAAHTITITAQAAVIQAQAAVRQAEAAVVAIASVSRNVQTVNPAQSAVMDAIYNPDAAPSHGGIAAVKQYAASLTRVGGIDGGVMDVLAQLRSTECATSFNACVMGDAFSNAVQQKMTVRDALEAFRRGENAGLNPDGVFGFENQPQSSSFSNALQPSFQTNFPYNSLVVLRKYRVLPVSWELAALYIKDHAGVCGPGKSCTLQDMVDAFGNSQSPFFRLVDPNWVLKLPSMYCALKGYGPAQEATKDTEQTMCKNDTNGDGTICCDKGCITKTTDGITVSTDTERTDCLRLGTCSLDEEEQNVVRMETCLDEQTCLDDDEQGKCKPKMYGYCLEEKKLWRFAGTQCDARYASCDEFVDKEKQTVSYYLKDSVTDLAACNADTAGCAWYSKTRFVGSAKTTGTSPNYLVKDWNSGDRVYLTPKAQTCNENAEGCRGIVDVAKISEDIAPPRAVLVANASWYTSAPNPTWKWLVDNNLISGEEDFTSTTAKQLAAKNYDIYIVDRYAWGVGDASKKAYDLWKKYGKNVISIGNDSTTDAPYPIAGYTYNSTGYASTFTTVHAIARGIASATDIGNTGDTGNIITSVKPEFTILYTKTSDSSKITGVIGESDTGGIWFHDQTGYLTENANGQAVLKNALRYMMSAATATAYMRIAPDYLNCKETEKPTGAPDTWKPAYRREECKSYALHCSQDYVGCELYTPQEAGGFPIAATNPNGGCKTACAGLTSYSVQRTRIESQLGIVPTVASASAEFIPTALTVQQCPVAEAGCDEFTNILAGAEAEKRDYFKDIRRCEKKPTKPEDITVFYSPMGSESAGYRLDIFTVKADTHGAPACYPGETCTCTEDDYYNQFTNPNTTTINCRQFYVNRDDSGSFEPEYYQIDKLIYYADDCKEYRRTLDDNGGTIHKITPSLSQTCSASSSRCREFRDPTAGNVVMVDYSNFEDGTAQGWNAFTGTTSLKANASNESESLGNHSLEMKENKTSGAVTFEKNGLLLLGNVSYLAGLSIKAPASATVKMDLLGFENQDGQTVAVTSATQNIPANTWRYLSFSFAKLVDIKPAVQGSTGIRITVTPTPQTGTLSSILLDTITIKQADGVIYAIDDSWVLPDECVADPQDKTTADVTQIGCKLYADRTGAQAVFRDVQRLCPNEMVGCKAYTKNNVPLYVVEDQLKSCLQADNGCTAYGSPTLDVAGGVSRRTVSTDTKTEDWITRYVKVPPEQADLGPDAQKGVCSELAVGCRAYTLGGQQDRYFKDPSKKVCKWRAAQEKEVDSIKLEIETVKGSTTLKPEEKQDRIIDLQNKISDKKANGVWYYMGCSGDVNTACVLDSDCGDIGLGTCSEQLCGKKCSGDTNVACIQDSDCGNIGLGTCLNMPKACPASQKTCRKITDSECVGGKLKTDYGRDTPDVSCQQDYYYLANVENRGECNGKVDVEGGCLLFNDANAGAQKYTSNSYYAKYFSGGLRGVPLNKEDSWNSTSTNDVNTLLKVRLDRVCKTWLECADYIVDSDTKKTVCTERVPCNKRGTDGTCANYIFRESVEQPEKEKVLQHALFTVPTSNTAAIPYASLTGMSRPDIRFKDGWSTSEKSIVHGHDTLFGWSQVEIGTSSPDTSTKQLYLKLSDSDNIVNTCRVRPRSDSPDLRWRGNKQKAGETKDSRKMYVNSCDYENKKDDRYQGTDGYCLEPYPKFTDTFFAASSTPNSRASFSSYGFKGACLNWYPSDRTKTAGVIGSTFNEKNSTFSTDDVYFCTEFGVNEHEETMKNAANDKDIVVDVPQVDSLPAIGRTIDSNAISYATFTPRIDRVWETTDAIPNGAPTPQDYRGTIATGSETPTGAPTGDIVGQLVTPRTTAYSFTPKKVQVCTTTNADPKGTPTCIIYTGILAEGSGNINGVPSGGDIAGKLVSTSRAWVPETCIPARGTKGDLSDVSGTMVSGDILANNNQDYIPNWDDSVKNDYISQVVDSIDYAGLQNVSGKCDDGKGSFLQVVKNHAGANNRGIYEKLTWEDLNPEYSNQSCPYTFSVTIQPKWGSSGSLDSWNVGHIGWQNQTFFTHAEFPITIHRHIPECGTTYVAKVQRQDKIETLTPNINGDNYIVSSTAYASGADGDIPQTTVKNLGWRSIRTIQDYALTKRVDTVTTLTPNTEGTDVILKSTPYSTTNLDEDQTGGKQNSKWRSVRTIQNYNSPRSRKDTIHYYAGNTEVSGSPITRTGTIETASNPNCAGTFNADPSCDRTPPTEIAAGEAKSDGTPIPIPKRAARPVKKAYKITAKAVYRDVYCKRVVKVVEARKSVGFNTKLADWGGASGKQLSEEDVDILLGTNKARKNPSQTKGPIIFKRTIKSWRWAEREPAFVWSATGSYYNSDTITWPTAGQTGYVNTSRYGYTDYQKAAKLRINSTSYALVQDHGSTCPASGNCDNARSDRTRSCTPGRDSSCPLKYADWTATPTDAQNMPSDREDDAIKVELANAATNNQSVFYGMTQFGELRAANSNNTDFVKGIDFLGDGPGFSGEIDPGIFDYISRTLNTPIATTETAIDALANGASIENFNVDNFDYGTTAQPISTPPIPFTRVYGDWTSGMPTLRVFSATIGKTFPYWFPATTHPRPVWYPEIFDEHRTENRFSYEKTTTAAPIIQMKFYVDVNEDQLPLRSLSINWGDGTNNSLQDDKGDGVGIGDLPPCAAITVDPCSNKKFEVKHVFRNNKIDGNVVCIEAMDNWERTTKACNTLLVPGFNGNPVETH